MNKRMRLENGITLIALVITIIVLLILAGVTIATLTGENGLLNKAGIAKEQTIIAEEKEEIALAYNAVKIKNKGGAVTAEELETELKGKGKVIEKNSKLVITYQETGRKYYIKQDGKIEKLEGENTEIDIQVGDIIFTYSIEGEEYNESIWTNKNVKVTAKINEEKITNNGDYEIQITRTPDIEESWKTETVEEFTTNGTLYARLIDTFERKTKSTLSTNVTNIDKDTPIIENVTGSTSTANSGSIIVSSILDTGGSGLSGIYISTSSTIPSVDASEWENNTEASYAKTVTENGTYYVWVKDNAGNISGTKTCIVSGIVGKVTGVTLTDTTVDKGSTVTISKTLIGSTSYKSIAFTSSNTEVATIVSDTGVVTGVTEGTSTITCTVTNYDGTEVTGECIVTVKMTLAGQVAIGDYVAYNATNNYSYTSPVGSGSSHGNGSSSQTFTSSSSIKWRVLSKNTSTGEVVLISEKPIGSLTLNGAIGYLYGEEEINKICSIYGHGVGANTDKTFTYETGDIVEGVTTGYLKGSGARSIKAEDVNKATGYSPSSYRPSAGTWYGSSRTMQTFYPTKTTTSGISETAEQRTYVSTSYSYYDYVGYSSDLDWQLVLLNVSGSKYYTSYWVASRTVYYHPSYHTFSFSVERVGSGGISGQGHFGSYSDSYYELDEEKGVRPLVYLKPNIITNGQDSSGAWKIIDN